MPLTSEQVEVERRAFAAQWPRYEVDWAWPDVPIIRRPGQPSRTAEGEWRGWLARAEAAWGQAEGAAFLALTTDSFGFDPHHARERAKEACRRAMEPRQSQEGAQGGA